jgi:competence protein ComEC
VVVQRVVPFAESTRFSAEAAVAAWLSAGRGRWALFLPAFMACGVVLYFSLTSEPPLWTAASVVLGAAAASLAARRSAAARATWLCLAFAAAGFASASIATYLAPPWDSLPRKAAVLRGRVAQVDALPAGRRVTFVAASLDGGLKLNRMVRLRLRDTDQAALGPGDVAQVRALLRAPAPPDYPGGWDTQRDAYFSSMGAYGFALGQTQVIEQAHAGAWRTVRERAAANIMAVLPGERGAIAATLLTGLGTAIPADDRAAFAASGLAHLLAVAGLHIGIVMGLVFAMTRTALAAVEHAALHWPTRQIASLTAFGAGAVYMMLTGAHVPILRSFVMAALVTVAVMTGRRAIGMRALALAALGLMLMAPNEVMGVSFQMSFAAVLALVAGWEALRPFLAGFALGRWWRTPVLYVGGLAATSALAGTASLPFAAYHFGTETLWYVPANMLAVPVTALWVMPCGIAALVLMPFGQAAMALVPMAWGIGCLLALARGVAAWPGAVMPVPQLPPSVPLLFAAGLLWLCLLRTKLRLAGIAAILAACALPFLHTPPDLFVSQDGRVLAARVGGKVLVEARPGASAFERAAPARIWGVSAYRAFPAAGDAAGGAVHCTAQHCSWIAGAGAIVLARVPGDPCAGADIAIAGIFLRDCGAPVIIDREAAAADGAALVTGTEVVTDRSGRGDRPWVLTTAPALPAARTE